MSPWLQVVIALGVVAVTVVIIPAVITLRRVLHRAGAIMLMVERDLGPLVLQLQGLTEDLRALVRQGNRELERLGAMAERVSDLSERAMRLVNIFGGFTRVGQVLGVAAGLKKGLGVFVHRMRRQGGHNDG